MPDSVSPPTAYEPPARLSAWLALAVLVGVTLFAFVDRQILALVAAPLQQSLGLSDLQLGALQGLGLALFAAVASYPIGWLADRFDRRLILCGGILVWSCATAACALQTSFPGLFISTIGIAIGEAGLQPIIWAVLADLFPGRQRATANSIFFAAGVLGLSAGLGISGAVFGWLTAHGAELPAPFGTLEPWRATLLLVATPGPIFMVLVALLKIGGSQRARIAASQAVARAGGFAAYARRNLRTMACVYGAVAAYNIGVGSTLSWMPVALPRLFPVEPAEIGVQLSLALAVASVVGVSLSAAAVKLWPGERVLAGLRVAGAAFLLAAVPTLLLPFVGASWQAMALVGVQFAAGLAAAALMPGIVQEMSPPSLRARSIAIMVVVSALPLGISPTLIGGLSEAIGGPRSLLIAIGLVGTPAWVLAALLNWLAEHPFRRTAAEVTGQA